MKTLVLFGLCAGVVVSSVQAEGRERKDPHTERGGKHERPPFGHRGDIFRKMDGDGDGNISKEEFFSGPRIEKLPVDKRETIFARLDADGDGILSREEVREMRKDAKNRAKREFRSLDKDKSGGLSFEEFSEGQFFAKLPEEKRRQIFNRMDTDGSGEITAEDRPKGPPKRKERPAD